MAPNTPKRKHELMRISEAVKLLDWPRSTLTHRMSTGRFRTKSVAGVTFLYRAEVEAAKADEGAGTSQMAA